MHVEDYHALGTEPGFCHHCHTGRCPVGLTTQVVIEKPGTIERSLGKARRIVDNRPKA